MRLPRTVLFFLVTAAYCLTLFAQERIFQDKPDTLQPAPSAAFLRAVSGYLRQLTGEILFIRSSVFLGGVPPGTDPRTYAPVLAHNYLQITTLYPQFIDPYYFAQSNLANVAPEFARATDTILTTAREAYPTDLVFPFFQGFNLFRYLDEPLAAAEVFRQASRLPEAPPMFGRLAAILEAQGGHLQAAIISLQAMARTTNDEEAIKRYYDEISMLKQATRVQKAVDDFFAAQQRYPNALDELIPEFIPALPTFGTAFVLTWNPPHVGLKRPHLVKQTEKTKGIPSL
jgi:hypothetical protein